MMIGAHSFRSDDEGKTLCFQFKAGQKANYCSITLNSFDLYNMRIERIRDLKSTLVDEFTNIDNDQLIICFEDATGLTLQRPNIVFTKPAGAVAINSAE